MNAELPAPRSVDELETHLSEPTREVIESLARLNGDLILLGVGGKMGPTMARMARRALDEAGVSRRVIGVSRFKTPGLAERLAGWGIETLSADLLAEAEVASLPDAALVIAMSGFKFGASRDPETSWATNCYLPMLTCRRYAASRIVAFSTGNVYATVPVMSGGSRETDAPQPNGEYAMAALGRERMYQYFSREWRIPTVILRLNYATELRYGVLVDIAQQVQSGKTIDCTMGHVNVIWLRDANAMTLRALEQTTTPARTLNLAGAEILRIRDVGDEFGRRLGKQVRWTGTESSTAFLNRGIEAYSFLGTPEKSARQMIAWTADWIARGGESLGKPTHFQTADGKF